MITLIKCTIFSIQNMSKEIQKHIQELFDIQQLLGSGAYGHVWKVIQKSTKKTYALKKVFDAFQNNVDAQRTYRQITILHELDNPHIVKLKGVIKAQNDKDLYLLFQHMETDLHSLVGQNILEMSHFLFIIYQVFKTLKYLHSAQLVHRDLKPSNILINSDCQIKLCDFGLVRSLTHEEDTHLVLSEDVATRWYRSPQMLLGSQEYGWATDVWSAGCILAELMIGQPLLMGSSNIQQLQKILELTGIPKHQDIASVNSPVGQTLIQQFGNSKKPFRQYFKGSKFQYESELISLIKGMLEFNPSKRITVEEVLQHELFAEMRCQKQEVICRKMIIPELDDNERLNMEKYRQSIYKDIQRRYPTYNPKQLKQQQRPSSIFRYNRGHSSLMNRTTCVNSFTRAKATNSLLKPNRGNKSHKTTFESQSKLNHHSLHSNTAHNSNFFKAAVSGSEQKIQSFSLYRQNPFVSVQNKNRGQNKESTHDSQVMEKSPFRKFKRFQKIQGGKNTLQRIEGSWKENSLSQQNIVVKKQKLKTYFSHQQTQGSSSTSYEKQSNHTSSKCYLFDPSKIYNLQPPKQARRKERNFYNIQEVSNQGKIIKKTFTRERKQNLVSIANDRKDASENIPV